MEDLERVFWWNKWYTPKNADHKALEFQKRIHLDLTRLTQEQYLYLCRNGLALEVCRVVKACLMKSETFSHINLTAANKTQHSLDTCIFSLGHAIVADDEDLISSLLQTGGIDPSIGTNLAIRIASLFGNTTVIPLLLQDDRVDPSALDNDAIIIASRYGHVEVVRLLLQDDRVDPSANNNESIIVASRKGHVEVVRLLLDDKRVLDCGGIDGIIAKIAALN